MGDSQSKEKLENSDKYRSYCDIISSSNELRGVWISSKGYTVLFASFFLMFSDFFFLFCLENFL